MKKQTIVMQSIVIHRERKIGVSESWMVLTSLLFKAEAQISFIHSFNIVGDVH